MRLNLAKKSKVRGLIDKDQVAIAGKSLGAITVMQAGYNPQWVNPSVKAVIALTGAAGNGVDFTQYSTPLLLIHGDADTSVPISGSQEAYANATPPKFFITLFGQTHGSAFGGGNKPAEKIVNEAPIDFLDFWLQHQKTGLERLKNDGDVPDVSSYQSTG